jgi:hypothetical protein
MQRRGYIIPGPIIILTNVFAIPKVKDKNGLTLDIRPVYDAMKSGLNDAVWVPTFWMPTCETLFRCLEFTSWIGDSNLGEMFLNHHLEPRMHPYAGMDLTGFVTSEERGDHRVL